MPQIPVIASVLSFRLSTVGKREGKRRDRARRYRFVLIRNELLGDGGVLRVGRLRLGVCLAG